MDSHHSVTFAARAERVQDFAALVPDSDPTHDPTGRADEEGTHESRGKSRVQVERVTAGVPWPRGLALVDGKLIVLARGRHRRAGGIDPRIPDRSGTLMEVDPNVTELIVSGEPASPRTKTNARPFTAPDPEVFELYDASTTPIENTAVDRPYCTLAYDPTSRNLFVCGFSGVDLPGSKFRKNASDSIHRFDLRTGRWYPVEMHDHTVVPESELGYVVPNQYYPHHDPAQNAAPHGWLNGPDACAGAGDYLYAAGKDNHVIAQYDLRGIRANPDAAPPASRIALGPRVQLRLADGTRKDILALGPSAIAAHGDHLYVGYRTSSIVVRYPIDARGDLVKPAVGELIAVFEPWDAEKKRSANLIDLAFNSKGEMFVSCAKEARIWKVGVPDPQRPFYGDDQSDRPTTAPPFVDIRKWTGKKAGCGNLLFDGQDRLFFCVGNYDHGQTLAGAVYRATSLD